MPTSPQLAQVVGGARPGAGALSLRGEVGEGRCSTGDLELVSSVVTTSLRSTGYSFRADETLVGYHWPSSRLYVASTVPSGDRGASSAIYRGGGEQSSVEAKRIPHRRT